MSDRHELAASFVAQVRDRNPDQPEFLQAVREVAQDVITIEKADAGYAAAKVLERLSEPDRMISFRVTWEDDQGEIQINRGWRVQMSNAIGPYKGGIRFHPTVSPSVLKFLAFEQVFKNALTGLPLGGGKGGADFDPKGRSDREIMRFCQAFMAELNNHIGPDRDVPAGDINVGTREIGYLFGAYKRAEGQFHGAITGKGSSFGGSALRVEATGYGLIYFVSEMNGGIQGKRVAISGKGNVATHAAEKAICEGARVVTLSDTSGVLFAEDGMTQDAVAWVQQQKAAGADVSDPPSSLGLSFEPSGTPWARDIDIALPCATENEIDAEAAQQIVDSGAKIVAEGANMPLTTDAVGIVERAGISYAPGKAANAGGVAISGLEMSQNAHGQFSSADEVDLALKSIMRNIHRRVRDEDRDSYRRGANVAGFRKVADAITAYGII